MMKRVGEKEREWESVFMWTEFHVSLITRCRRPVFPGRWWRWH